MNGTRIEALYATNISAFPWSPDHGLAQTPLRSKEGTPRQRLGRFNLSLRQYFGDNEKEIELNPLGAEAPLRGRKYLGDNPRRPREAENGFIKPHPGFPLESSPGM